MFSLDPMLTSTGQSTCRFYFRSDVKQRGGDQCILTGVIGIYCDAAHLLIHPNGDSV